MHLSDIKKIGRVHIYQTYANENIFPDQCFLCHQDYFILAQICLLYYIALRIDL
jgi:hypothetical protein